MDMPAPAPNALNPSALGSVSASLSAQLAPAAVMWTTLGPAIAARYSAFNAWCAEVQSTPMGKVVIALLCLVEITLVTLVVWRVREYGMLFGADDQATFGDSSALSRLRQA